MTDQTPQGGLYGPQSAPDDSRAAEGATKAGDGRTAARDGLREQYAARAFNAVAPALKVHDRWLPLSVRRAVADAVLAVRDAELEQLRAERDDARATIARVTAVRDQLADLARDFLDPDPCEYDHHGYCQAHGYLGGEPHTCPHKRARALLGVLDQQPAPRRYPITGHAYQGAGHLHPCTAEGYGICGVTEYDHQKTERDGR